MTLAKETKVFKGERPYLITERVESATPTQLLGDPKARLELNLTSVRFVNTDKTASTDLEPMLYLVPDTETTPTLEHEFYAPFVVPPGKAFREYGSQDSPLIAIPPGWSLWVAALAGAMNVFLNFSRDTREGLSS